MGPAATRIPLGGLPPGAGQVCKRLGRRLAVLGVNGLSDYRVLLAADAAAWRQLDGLCRISVSRFYRDQGVWRDLERELLPRLAAHAVVRGESRLRIWSAGCASGEEPYTLSHFARHLLPRFRDRREDDVMSESPHRVL